MVEDALTVYNEQFECTAELGFPDGESRVLKMELRLDSQTDFTLFSPTNAIQMMDTPGNCSITKTLSYEYVNMLSTYNNSVIRCSVFEDETSDVPTVSKEKTIQLLSSESTTCFIVLTTIQQCFYKLFIRC